MQHQHTQKPELPHESDSDHNSTKHTHAKRLDAESESLPLYLQRSQTQLLQRQPLEEEEEELQTKLKIGAPNDRYEQEADRVADQVMRMPEPKVQRQAEPEEEEEEPIQTKPIANTITPLVQRQVEPEEEELIQAETRSGTTSKVTPATRSAIQSLQSGGQPLSGSERSFFEPRFGANFSNVRLHNDIRASSMARSVRARAFTFGTNVVFGAGEYSSDSLAGRHLLAHELTHVIQQKQQDVPKLQRKIVVDGKPYTPSAKYYKYLTSNFGSHMKEFVKNMHNTGNPPQYTFSSYQQMGFEVRVRHQAIKGMEEVHKGCCDYYSTATPPYLDSTYWDQVGIGVKFKPKAPLPSGKHASDAIKAIFLSGANTRLECLAMTIAIEYYALLKGIGDAKFNAMFPGGVGIEISTNAATPPLLTGAAKKYKIIAVSNKSEILPGDWVYFKNFSDYLIKHPNGYWQGENAIYMGNRKYRGFGVAALSEDDLNKELVKEYNKGLPAASKKTLPQLIANGGGLMLDPVIRPKTSVLPT